VPTWEKVPPGRGKKRITGFQKELLRRGAHLEKSRLSGGDFLEGGGVGKEEALG